MQRNTWFAGLSMLVTGTAIGAGVVASGNVLADSGASAELGGTVQVVSVSTRADGTTDAFSCTLDDVELSSVIGANAPGSSGVIAVTGAAAVAADDTTTYDVSTGGVATGSVTVEAGEMAGARPVGVAGALPVEVAGALPVGVDGALPIDVIDADAVRAGTAQECAGVQATSSVAAGGVGSGGDVVVGAEDAIPTTEG